MNDIRILCDEHDFGTLAEAFSGEFESDCTLAAEILITGREEIRRLNREFRQVDWETDVLSFPTLDKILGRRISAKDFPYDTQEDGTLFIGSVAICEDVAREQADEYGHGFDRELYYLATHGLCHLLGYDHMTEADKSAMRAKEEKIMTKLNLKRD